ncbi:MAG: hypothetical protein U0800_06440 [Isosphaeraceae bacterium]
MAWKLIKGRRYYYRSKRVGAKVRTEYCGAGNFAELAAGLDESERLDRAEERERLRAEKAEAAGDDRDLAGWFDRIQAEADAAMEAAGFHKHRGQWRRRR